MRRGLLQAALVTALVLASGAISSMSTVSTAAAASIAPSSWCTGSSHLRLAFKGATRAADGTFTPIVLVHGFAGDSTIWEKNLDRVEIAGEQGARQQSLRQALQALPGAAVFTYDYRDHSTDWVTQDSIAADLGTDIDCLAIESAGKVVVVAHSMGGLALREALHLGGAARAAEVQEVVTFGTPNSGSQIARIAQAVGSGTPLKGSDADLFGVLSMLKAGCPHASVVGFSCGWWDQLWTGTRTPAAVALASGSREMTQLRPWPAGVHVRALAADMDIQLSRSVTWFGQQFDGAANHVVVGDSLVMTDSARGGARDSNIGSCSYALDLSAEGSILAHLTGLKGAPSIADLGASGCFHGNLPSDIHLANQALGDVSQLLRVQHAHFDPMSMEVPVMCVRSSGRMKNGLFPPDATAGAAGQTPVDWLYTDAEHGTSDGTEDQHVRLSETQPPTDKNGHVAAATAVGCFSGGSAILPDSLVFSSGDGSLLGSFDLGTLTQGTHAYIQSIDLHGPSATVTWIGSGPLSQGLPDNYLQSTATFTYTGSKTLSMSDRVDSGVGLGGTIGFGRIGSLIDTMTLEQLKARLSSTAPADAGNPACAAITFGSADASDEHDRILSLVSALAQSKGASGPADMLVVAAGSETGRLSSNAAEIRLLPKTAKGIGLGSTLAKVRLAYPGAKRTTGPGYQQLDIEDGAGRTIRFLVDESNRVVEIATGRTRYLSTYDWCG